MDRLQKQLQGSAVVAAILLSFSVGLAGIMVSVVSPLPEYNPYRLNEEFDSFDTNIWEVGGDENYTLSDGMLTLYDGTSATYYFVTHPKWRSPYQEVELVGRIEIRFRVSICCNGSLAVVNMDSSQLYATSQGFVIDLFEENGRSQALMNVDSNWHSLIVESEPRSVVLVIDDKTVYVSTDWVNNLTRVELGTSLPMVGGLKVEGALTVDWVKADLRPVTAIDLSTFEDQTKEVLLRVPSKDQEEVVE